MILFDFLFQQSPFDGYVPTKNALIAPFGRSKIVSGGSSSQPRPPAEVFVWHIPVGRLSIALNTNLTQIKNKTVTNPSVFLRSNPPPCIVVPPYSPIHPPLMVIYSHVAINDKLEVKMKSEEVRTT